MTIVQYEMDETENDYDYNKDVTVKTNMDVGLRKTPANMDSHLAVRNEIDVTGDCHMDVKIEGPPILVKTKKVDTRKPLSPEMDPQQRVTYERSNSRDKSYQCSHCKTSFANNGVVVKNQQKRTGNDPYKCSHCDTSFDNKNVLIQQQIKHNGEKSYNDDEEASNYVTKNTLQGKVKPYSHGKKSYNYGVESLQNVTKISKNNTEGNILTKQYKQMDKDEADTSINGHIGADVPSALQDQNTCRVDIPSNNVQKNTAAKEICCIFCLDGGNLIHMCACSVLAHKECALAYIRFPGSMNDRCCHCREKLEFTVIDKDTPMKLKYVFAFLILLGVYAAIVGLSVYYTMQMFDDNMNKYVKIVLVANISILWPVIIVYIFIFLVDCCCSPRDRTSHSPCGNAGCYCSGDCGGGCGDCGCGDCNSCGSADGDACCGIVCVICFVAVMALVIAASAYLLWTIYKHYKSFCLKSKNKIEFRYEKRPINTVDY